MAILKKCAVLFFFISFSVTLHSQIDTTTVKLREVIIETERLDNQANKNPASVFILKKDDIDETPVFSFDDVFVNAPGVFVSRPFGIFGSSTVGVRGFGTNEQGRVLVLLDGIPINKSDLGGVNWNRITPSDIQKTEIIKGPNSSLYGTGAIGGIINIISVPNRQSTNGTETNVSFGTYNTFSASTSVTQRVLKNKKLILKSNIMYRAGDGYITAPDSLRDSTSIASWMKEFSASLSGNYILSENVDADFSYNYYNDRRSQGIQIYDETGNATDHDTHFFRNRFRGKMNRLKWSVNYFFQNEHYFKISESLRKTYSLYHVNSYRNDYGILSDLSFRTERYRLKTGVDVRAGNVSGTDEYLTDPDIVENSGEIINLSGFINNRLNISNSLFFNAGAHYNLIFLKNIEFKLEETTSVTDFLLPYQNNISDKRHTFFSPEFSLLFEKRNYRMYLSYSDGYRNPTLDDLTRTGFIAGAFKIANPDLKPERTDNAEFGFSTLTGKINFQFSAYYSLSRDFMYYSQTGDYLFGKKPIVIKQNITKIKLYGSELSFSYRYNSSADFFINYTYNKNEIIDFITEPDLTGKKLTFSPENQLNAGINLFVLKKVRLNLSYNYFSKQFTNEENSRIISAQSLLNVKIMIPFYKYFEISFSGRNLLNKQYLVNYTQLSIGRFWNLMLSVKLD